jgi:outer membrane lipoprotein-sorting protein
MKKILLSLALTAVAFAQDGYEISKKSWKNQRGFGDEKAKTTLELIAANGTVVKREMINLTLEQPGDKDLSLIQFLNPADVRGTGLLTHQNPAGDDKQWLYMPAVRRTKKISSSNKSGSFMASEFSYEDISGNTLDKWTYKFLREETLGGKECYVIEKAPRYKNSGYSKVTTWITKENYLGIRSEFWDRKGSLLKVQEIDGWKQYGSAWRAAKISITNVQTNKKSVLSWSERQMKQGLDKKDFSRKVLKREVRI